MIAAAFQHIGHIPLLCGQITLVGVVQGIHRDGTVVDDEAVQVAIAIVIKERSLRGIAIVIQPVFFCSFCKSKVVVIDEKLVPPQFRVKHIAGITDINIQPAVVVDINQYNTGTPLFFCRKTGSFRNIFKLKIPFVEVELVASLVGSKKNIRQPVIVEVADGNTAAIIKIPVIEHIETAVLREFVLEMNGAVFNQAEQSVFLFLATGETGYNKEDENKLEATIPIHV
jgi:hypothetical protein